MKAEDLRDSRHAQTSAWTRPGAAPPAGKASTPPHTCPTTARQTQTQPAQTHPTPQPKPTTRPTAPTEQRPATVRTLKSNNVVVAAPTSCHTPDATDASPVRSESANLGTEEPRPVASRPAPAPTKKRRTGAQERAAPTTAALQLTLWLLLLVASITPAHAQSYLYKEKTMVWGSGCNGWTQILGTAGPADPNHQIACAARIGPSLGYQFLIDSYGEGCTPPLGRPAGTGPTGSPWVVNDGGSTSSYYFNTGCADLPADFPAPSWYILSSAFASDFLISKQALPGAYHWSLVGGDRGCDFKPPLKFMGYVNISAPRDPAWQITVQLKHPFGTFPWLDYSTQSGTLYLMKGNYVIIYSTYGFYREYTVSVPGEGKTNKYVVTNNGASQVALVPDSGNTTPTPIPLTELPTPTDYQNDEAAANAGSGTYTGPPATTEWWQNLFTTLFVPQQPGISTWSDVWDPIRNWGPIGLATKSLNAWFTHPNDTCGAHSDCGTVWQFYVSFSPAGAVPQGDNQGGSYTLDWRPPLPPDQQYSDGGSGTFLGTMREYVWWILDAAVYFVGVLALVKRYWPKQVI